MNTISRIMMMALASAVAAGCSTSFNGQSEALTYAQEHPISVDSQVITMTLSGDSLSDIDRARIKAFANAYMNNGHGPVTITTPARGNDGSRRKEADARDALLGAGLDYGAIATANYAPNGATSDDVILSYTHYVATPSACGLWSGLRERDHENRRSPNFGCATQNNLAAMIGDPRDLVTPAGMTSPDSQLRIRGVEAFREGEVTATARDGNIEANASEQ